MAKQEYVDFVREHFKTDLTESSMMAEYALGEDLSNQFIEEKVHEMEAFGELHWWTSEDERILCYFQLVFPVERALEDLKKNFSKEILKDETFLQRVSETISIIPDGGMVQAVNAVLGPTFVIRTWMLRYAATRAIIAMRIKEVLEKDNSFQTMLRSFKTKTKPAA